METSRLRHFRQTNMIGLTHNLGILLTVENLLQVLAYLIHGCHHFVDFDDLDSCSIIDTILCIRNKYKVHINLSTIELVPFFFSEQIAASQIKSDIFKSHTISVIPAKLCSSFSKPLDTIGIKSASAFGMYCRLIYIMLDLRSTYMVLKCL